MAQERILVVDDEPGVRTALEAILTDEGFRVQSVGSGELGLAAVQSDPFDAVLLDVWLPGIDGIETLERMRESHPDLEVIMISGHATIDTAVKATKLGAFDFVEKPLSLEKTLLVLRNALRQRRLERVNRRLMVQLTRDTEILGRSPAAERLRKQAALALDGAGPVLIRGPQGSGRENLARHLHSAGDRADQAFVEVPCAALDPVAAEQVLHGGAGRPGRLALAAGGSLFLEDVDRLPGPAQQRLSVALAALSRQPRPPRVLASAAPGGRGLHADLRRLLSEVTIDVPPLQARREDLPLLAERFMRELSREYGRPPRRLSADCLSALTAYDWPGEMRELRNLVERLLLFSADEIVQRVDLPAALGGSGQATDDLYRLFPSLADAVEAYEAYYVARIVAEENGDLLAAAARLGVSERELRERQARRP